MPCLPIYLSIHHCQSILIPPKNVSQHSQTNQFTSISLSCWSHARQACAPIQGYRLRWSWRPWITVVVIEHNIVVFSKPCGHSVSISLRQHFHYQTNGRQSSTHSQSCHWFLPLFLLLWIDCILHIFSCITILVVHILILYCVCVWRC